MSKSLSDTEHLAELVHGLGGADFWYLLQEAMNSVLHYDSLLVLTYHADSKPQCLFDSVPAERRKIVIEDYLAGPFLLDPLYSVALNTNLLGFYTVRSIAPDRFTSSRYFQLHYANTGVHDELALITRPAKFCAVVSLFRTTEFKLFSHLEVKRLRKHQRLLCALIERHLLQSDNAHKQQVTQLKEMLGQISNQLPTHLTRREMEIALMILRGHSSLSIACNLNIVEGTVKIHRKNLYKKLNISSQAELFSLFVRQMLTLGRNNSEQATIA